MISWAKTTQPALLRSAPAAILRNIILQSILQVNEEKLALQVRDHLDISQTTLLQDAWRTRFDELADIA